MNEPATDDDRALRSELHQTAQAQAGDTRALEDAVFARWQAEHAPQPVLQPQLAGAGGLGARSGRPWQRGSVLALAVALLLALWWAKRQDAAMEELMQVDVLSQIAIGEL